MFFMKYITDTIIEQHVLLKKGKRALQIIVVLLVCGYCVNYSFDVMGRLRPSAKDIGEFLKQQRTED